MPISRKRVEISQIPKNFSQALLLGVRATRMIIGFKLFQIFFCQNQTVNGIFKVVKMNFGSKFWAWVSFHTAILQS